jgi:crotonobetainyl-CoA:carnitine CoA-transferase CaiB-like acyl-CoA transferase
MRPYEGIKIIDITHVLAGPFAAYQLALLGADVIKVEHPTDSTRAGTRAATAPSTSSGWAPASSRRRRTSARSR